MPALIPLNTIPSAPGVYPVLNLEGQFSIESQTPTRVYLLLSANKGTIGIPTRVTSYEDFINQFDLAPSTPTMAQVNRDAVDAYFRIAGNLGELFVTRVDSVPPSGGLVAKFIESLNGFDPERHSHGFVCCPEIYCYKSPADRLAFQQAVEALVSSVDFQWVGVIDGTLPTEAYAAASTTLPDGRVIVPSIANTFAATVVPAPALATSTQTVVANFWISEVATFASANGHSWYYCNPGVNASGRLVPLSLVMAAVSSLRYYADGFRAAPAGQKFPAVGLSGVAVNFNKANQSALNGAHANIARWIAGSGVCIMGARTIYKADSAWRFCHVRVIFNVLSSYLRAAYQSQVFDPIDGQGVAFIRAKSTANAICNRFWQAGTLFGQTPEQAYYVQCDQRNNPAFDLELGRLRIDVYAAPCGVAERIIVGTYRVPIGQVTQFDQG
jgi:hypothetical protein